MGGADTEVWHTVKLWRRTGLDVHLIPTWGFDDRWRARLDKLGCVIHPTRPDDLQRNGDGSWHGQWLEHEWMPVEVIPLEG